MATKAEKKNMYYHNTENIEKTGCLFLIYCTTTLSTFFLLRCLLGSAAKFDNLRFIETNKVRSQAVCGMRSTCLALNNKRSASAQSINQD